MISYRNIRTLALALIVATVAAGEVQAQRFRGGSFGGRSGFGGSASGFRGYSSSFRGYVSSGFRNGYGFRSGYRYAPYRGYGYGFNRRDRDFRYGYGYGYPYAYGYPFGYGYPFAYGWGYGNPYAGYGDYGMDLLPGSSYAGGWQGTGMPAAADQGQGAATMDSGIAAAEATAFTGRLQWPLGLRILPGADSLRERIDVLYAAAAAQALTGQSNPQLPLQLKRAVKELKRLVAWNRQEKLTLSSTMYEEAEEFLHEVARSATRFSALESSRPSNPHAGKPVLPMPTKK